MVMVLPPRSSSSALPRTDSVDSIPNNQRFTSRLSQIIERRREIKRLMTFTPGDLSPESRRENSVQTPTVTSSRSIRELMQQNDDEYRGEEETMASLSNYEDYLDGLLQKLTLLMSLNPPWDLNESETVTGVNETTAESLQKSVRKPLRVIEEETGVIPETKEDLVTACVNKYLLRCTTVSVRHLRDSLLHRTQNARTKQQILEEGLQFLKMLTPFPQASRLFLLGLRHEMTVCSHYYVGGYHDRRRRREGAYSVDYLENCEGASLPALYSIVKTLESLCQFLLTIFSRCVENLQWRLGTSILWFIMTATSPKLPYFHCHLNLATALETNIWKLNKWYEMTNGYSRELLLSPGAFWDSLSQKPIKLSESHFHHLLQELQHQGSSVNPQHIVIPGIFPVGVMGLANTMRLAYTLLLVNQFMDYPSRSIQSPAKNADTLFHWTLTDMSNLFIRLSSTYLIHTQTHFNQFMSFFTRMQGVMRERSGSWQPFAPISYTKNDTDINLYTCMKVVDAKNIMRGMIATDMLISAGEGVLASYLALLLFIIKTRLSVIIPWAQYSDMLWNMLYFSPRHQKLTMMLFQYIIPATNYIPPVFDTPTLPFPQITQGHSESDSLVQNPMLQPPYFPHSEPPVPAKREAFIYFLLHLVSHADCCPASLVGERSSCSLCCSFFPFIYNTLCHSSPAYSHPDKEKFIKEIEETEQKVFVSTCKMRIRPEGHTASFCSLVFAEEVAYLLRVMLRMKEWSILMQHIFQDILDTAATHLASETNIQELENTDNHGFHVVLRRRSPWFCMATAVLKVLGAITPRMYAGSRIRIHEFLMDGENDVSTLIHAAYQSHGTGTIIKYHRSMGEALILMDKMDTPKLINCYVFDVVDRIEPPQDTDGKYAGFLESIQLILNRLSLHEEVLSLPTSDMPFFNTSDLSLMPSEVQNCILYLYCVRCINHLLISNQKLVSHIHSATIKQLVDIAIRPLPCNISINTLIIRQYFNLFIEYLIDTFPGSSRLLPMELQTEEVGESFDEVDLQDCYGVGKEERNEVDDTYGRPNVIRYERRMRVATEIAERFDMEPDRLYRILQVST